MSNRVDVTVVNTDSTHRFRLQPKRGSITDTRLSQQACTSAAFLQWDQPRHPVMSCHLSNDHVHGGAADHIVSGQDWNNTHFVQDLIGNARVSLVSLTLRDNRTSKTHLQEVNPHEDGKDASVNLTLDDFALRRVVVRYVYKQ